jgi:methionyl-tRNA formyltransferase
MNIVLVTHDSAYSRCLAAGLADSSVIDKIIVEYGRPSRKFYYSKLKKVGVVDFVFQFFLNVWFRKQGALLLPPVAMPSHIRVDNINSYTFGAEDLIIGFGTSYITKRTLKKLKYGFLNLHTGVLPQYRGVKSEFWTLFKKDYSNLGWTLHFMSPKIDEGDIIHVGRVSFDGENPAQLRAKIITDAIPALVEIIRKLRVEGTTALTGLRQEGGEYFSTPTLRQWLHYRKTCKKFGR